LGKDEWLKGEVSISGGEGSALEGGDSSHPNIHDECIPTPKDTWLKDKFYDVEILVGA
jgi:hypothetical protein